MSRELEALQSIEATIELGLKDSIHFEELDVTVNLDKGAFLNDVIIIRQALKRDEPMKVDLDNSGQFYYCPKCNIKHVKVFDNYCTSCGQKLDWSDYFDPNYFTRVEQELDRSDDE